MHFGLDLDLSDIDLLNIVLLDTHLDLLDTNTPSKHFVFLQDVLKASSRHLWRCLQDIIFSLLKDTKMIRIKLPEKFWLFAESLNMENLFFKNSLYA